MIDKHDTDRVQVSWKCPKMGFDTYGDMNPGLRSL